MIKELPVILTDKDGKVISINEAAHKVCAAMRIGDSILSHLNKGALGDYEKNVFLGSASFSIPSRFGTSFLFDMTKLDSHGVCTVYPENVKTAFSDVDFDTAAKEFEEAFVKSGFAGKKRFSVLYDTLVSKNAVFGANRRKSLYYLRSFVNRFVSDILPRHLYFGGDLFYTESPTVTDKSIIFAEAYSLYMLLSALFSVCGYISVSRQVSLKVSDCTDKTLFTLSTDTDGSLQYDSASDFGPRTSDFLYAESVARVSGYELTVETSVQDKTVSFLLTVANSDYYPSYLKADAGSEFILDTVSASVKYPLSAEE